MRTATTLEHPHEAHEAHPRYTLEADSTLAGSAPFGFRVVGPHGESLERFSPVHGKELHLIAVSRDLHTYRHVHPVRSHGGDWNADLADLPPGAYRLYADFLPEGGAPQTASTDLEVVDGTPGPPETLSPKTSDHVDGYDVSLDGSLAVGEESKVAITVRRDGQIVTTEPYLGAQGHLVAIREKELSYTHVHSLGTDAYQRIHFAVAVESPGLHALFFDFLHEGQVHTARFVTAVRPAAPA